jgi:hypothetical protein
VICLVQMLADTVAAYLKSLAFKCMADNTIRLRAVALSEGDRWYRYFAEFGMV